MKKEQDKEQNELKLMMHEDDADFIVAFTWSISKAEMRMNNVELLFELLKGVR